MVDGQSITGRVFGLSPGSRTFTLNAYDSDGKLIYSGSAEVDLVAGEMAQVAITLTPVPAEIVVKEKSVDLPVGSAMTMVLVPAGEFVMGGEEFQPIHTVYLDSFWIGKFEVTFEQMGAFGIGNEGYYTNEEDGTRRGLSVNGNFLDERGLKDFTIADHPLNWIRWETAQYYCNWAGLRLPTEAEWEKAARGTDERIFPWGDWLDEEKANYAYNHVINGNLIEIDGYEFWTSPVGSYPEGVSPYGAMDMAGNVAEYVSDFYAGGYYYDASAFVNPQGPHSAGGRPPSSHNRVPGGIFDAGEIEYYDNYVIRGGSYSDDPLLLRTFDRRSYQHSVGGNYYENADQKTGFRCAGDVN